MCFRNTLAARCSKRSRSRTELLTSIAKITLIRKVGSGLEIIQFNRWFVVVEKIQVIGCQVVNKSSLRVGDAQNEVYFINLL